MHISTKKMGRPRLPDTVKFWKKVKKFDNGCWLWQAPVMKDGYGQMKSSFGETKAHRIAWVLHYGPIPDGMLVCHKCDHRMCVNPDHLFLGTQKDNVQDMMRKGRKASVKGILNPQHKLYEQRSQQ